MYRYFGTVSAIKSLGYPHSECVSRCECDELPCPLLSWLCIQLRTHYPELKGGGNDLVLAGELKNMLSEMSSPFSGLTSEVLDTSTLNKITDYLLSELQAAIVSKEKGICFNEKTTEEESPKEQRVDFGGNPDNVCKEYEEDTGDANIDAKMQSEWKLVLETLDMAENSNIADVLNEVDSRISKLPYDVMSPLLHTNLSPEQWVKLDNINKVLSSDYQCRKQMMIKRFQVTLESFAWGDKERERNKVLSTIPPITSLDSTSNVSVPLVLAARINQSCIEPIHSGKSTSVYKVLMGAVPDRGGRPGEIEPPMPAWGERKTGHKSGKGSGSQKWRKFDKRKK